MLVTTLITTFLLAIRATAQPAWSNQSSPEFVLRSRPVGDCDFNRTLGYLHPTYIYSGTPYAGSLHQSRSDAIAGYFTFLPDAHSSSLVFPFTGANSTLFYGFYVNKAVTDQLISLPVGAYGLQGVYADAAHRLQILPEPQMSFYACLNWPLEFGPDTAVFSKIANTTTPSACVDIDLVVEYVDPRYNYPVPCPPSSLS